MTDKKHINDSLKNQDKNFNENFTQEKEQIIIDGEKYNKCNGCKLWDGYICTGDRSYEPNAEAHRAICNEHMAKEFWKVYHELFYKTQECEQLKEKYEALKLENEEGYEIVAELKQECEELKRKLSNQEQLYQNEIEIYNESCLQLRQENDDLYLERLALNTANSGINSLLEIKEQENDRYRKVFEEIEEVIKSPCAEDCVYYEPSRCYDCIKTSILDIINKAKGE